MESRSIPLEILVAFQVWYSRHRATFWLLWLGALPVSLAALKLYGPFEFQWGVILLPIAFGVGFLVASLPLAILRWQARTSRQS